MSPVPLSQMSNDFMRSERFTAATLGTCNVHFEEYS